MQLRLDSLTLIEIKNRVSFEGADLREQDLSKMNLSGAKLRFADLSDAHLKNANLRHIDLFGARLIRTDLSYCDISNGDLRRSNLSWADLSFSTLDKTNFDSAIVFSAKLRELESVNSSMRFIKANNAFFDQSKLLKTDFIGSSLQYTNFSQSVLDSSIFRLTVIDNIKLHGSSLKGIQIDDKNWIEELKTRGAEGTDSLEKFYVIAVDSLNTNLYRLTEVQK